MNKYLSYEKSKQLAELGYVSQNYYGYWGKALSQIVMLEYCVQHDLDTTEVYNKYIWHEGYGDFTKEYKSYDCHNLLVEIQKSMYDNGDWGNLTWYKESFTIEIPNKISFYEFKDENLIEVLGSALIKILEEKANAKS